jgi:hypothetical protein
VTQQVTADSTGKWLRELALVLRRLSVGRQVARTAGFKCRDKDESAAFCLQTSSSSSVPFLGWNESL